MGDLFHIGTGNKSSQRGYFARHILGGVTAAVRTAADRKADTLARLEADADVWVATANAGRPHLVPLSRLGA